MQATHSGLLWWFCSPLHALTLCFSIILKFPWLVHSNDANWQTDVTGLDEVNKFWLCALFCTSVRSVWNKQQTQTFLFSKSWYRIWQMGLLVNVQLTINFRVTWRSLLLLLDFKACSTHGSQACCLWSYLEQVSVF